MKALFITADGLEVLREVDDALPKLDLAYIGNQFAPKKWQVENAEIKCFSRTYERVETLPLAVYRERVDK